VNGLSLAKLSQSRFRFHSADYSILSLLNNFSLLQYLEHIVVTRDLRLNWLLGISPRFDCGQALLWEQGTAPSIADVALNGGFVPTTGSTSIG
jgi:hypothetical protein